MDTSKLPNMYRILTDILSNTSIPPIKPYSCVEWIEQTIVTYLPADKMELSLTNIPNAFRQILINIVIHGRKVASNIINPYTFRPTTYQLIGVVRSNGDCQPIVVTSNLSLVTTNTIHFLDIPSFLDDETNNVLIKSDVFFYLLTDTEIDTQFRLFPTLEDKIRQQKEFLKKYENDSDTS